MEDYKELHFDNDMRYQHEEIRIQQGSGHGKVEGHDSMSLQMEACKFLCYQ